MTLEMIYRAAQQPRLGKPATEQREAKSKAEEVLIEEILKAAGLEALD